MPDSTDGENKEILMEGQQDYDVHLETEETARPIDEPKPRRSQRIHGVADINHLLHYNLLHRWNQTHVTN